MLRTMKQQAEPASKCTSCVWADKQEGKVLCPFARCVEQQGWAADDKAASR